MTICDLCLKLQEDGKCELGLRRPTSMRCRDFDPGIEKFCAKPGDFTGLAQITDMAKYFGIKGQELKKISSIATAETGRREKSILAGSLKEG